MGWAVRRSRVGCAIALLIAVGCQSPPGRPVACGEVSLPRRAGLVEFAVRDTVVAAVWRPRPSLVSASTEPISYVRTWAAGIVHKRIGLRLLGPPGPIDPTRPTLDPFELEEYLHRVTGESLSPAEVRLYPDGCAALSALGSVIDSATRQLDVMMYLWGNDEAGWHVARKLAAKSGPNLPVRVLVDSGANLAQGEPRSANAAEVSAAVCWLAHQPDVEVVRTRNPCFRFDHRKLVVADGRIAWSGGRNFLTTAFERDRDLSYTVTGPLAAQLAEIFEKFWYVEGGRPSLPLPPPVPLAAPDAQARLIRTGAVDRATARALYRVVGSARHHVFIENPYFSDNRLLFLLAKARSEGADVRVVLTVEGDSVIFNHSNRAWANRLLKAGCRVYLYPGVLHTKALTADGRWAYVGTGNFDNLSLRHNRELGLGISDGPAIPELEQRIFAADFRPEWELTEPLRLGPLDYFYEFVASTAF